MSRTSCHLSPSKSGVRSKASTMHGLQNERCVSPITSETKIIKKWPGDNPPIAPVNMDDTVSNGSQVTLKGSQQSVHQPTPSLPLMSGSEEGHSPIHYESFYEPSPHHRCWTIRDFATASKNPKMLKPYKLKFEGAIPPIEFQLYFNKKNTLVLQPLVTKEHVKTYGSLFVKYGFSLGPHQKLDEDFMLYSPILKIKNINKTHLNIMESSVINHSYLVEGDLNLIVKYVPFSPKTQPVLDSIVELEKGLVLSCSQFSFISQNKVTTEEDVISEDVVDDTLCPPDISLAEKCSLVEDDEEEEEILNYDFYSRIKSKPLRRSRKSDFLRQKKAMCSHTTGGGGGEGSYYRPVNSPSNANFNQTM